jgi:hypothetical protein
VEPSNTRGLWTGGAGAQRAFVEAPIVGSHWLFPCTATRVFTESAPGLKRYYFHACQTSGTHVSSGIRDSYIQAKYYPTSYAAPPAAQ